MSGLLMFRIGENTVVLDANGNAITGDDLVPGEPARVDVEEENGGFSAQRIEVEEDDDEDDEDGHRAEVEFSGVVLTAGGGSITVQALFGLATVHIDSQTEVKGAIATGAVVEVRATLQDDESYLAREIKVEEPNGDDGGDGGHDGDGDDSSGSGSGDDRSGNSGPGSSSSGSGDDKDDS